MPIQVQTPDGNIAEFPDGMANSQIEAVLQQHYGAPKPQSIPEALKVDTPAQNWSNIGASSLQEAGIRPQLSNAETLKALSLSAIPFNLGDELAAGAQSEKYRFMPQEQPTYDKALAENRDVMSRYAHAHPIENIAIGIPGNVAATAAIPGGPITQGAIAGGLQGFGAGEGGFLNRMVSAGLGSAVGAGTSAGMQAVGKLFSNPKVNPDVQLLLDEGIPLTPGQVAGKVAKKTEDIATSVPVMGDFIANRQNESIVGLNRAVANRSLGSLPDTLKQALPDTVEAGRDTVSYVRDAMSKAYKDVLSKMNAAPDPQFSTDLQGVMQQASSVLPDTELNQFAKIVKSQISDKVAKSGGTLNGDTLKGIESELTKEIKGYGAGSWDEQKLAAALGDVKSAFRSLLTRQNPDQAGRLSAVDNAYAQFAILRRAGGSLGNDQGIFSPSQLLSAVKSSDTSAGKGNFASGVARMQDLADAAKNVLPSKFQDSGTVRRALQAGALAVGGPAALFTGHAIPAAAGVGVGSALYTRTGNELARAILASQRPAALSVTGDIIQKLGPKAGAIAALLATQPGQ